VVVGSWLLQPITLHSGCLSRQPIIQTAKQLFGGGQQLTKERDCRETLVAPCHMLIGENGNSLIYIDVGVH
jgi:hypothetical protein